MPIVKTEAARGEGVEELVEQLDAHRAYIEAEGTLSERRRRNLRNEVVALCTFRLRRGLEERLGAGRRRSPRCSTRSSRGAWIPRAPRPPSSSASTRAKRRRLAAVITGTHAIVFAQDAEAARAFFADVLGSRARSTPAAAG